MLKNIVANFVGRFWSILSNFLFIPLYINILGFESYSIISFTMVIAGLMAILDAGLSATLSREFARIDTTKQDKINIFNTLQSSYLLLITFCILILFFSSKLIASNWLNLSNYNPESVSFFLKIISFDIGFQLLLRFYVGGFLGLEKQVKANLYQIVWGLIRNGFVLIAIWFVPSLFMFFIWQSASTVIFALLIGFFLNKELTGNRVFSFRFSIEKCVLKKVKNFAGGMLLISFVSTLNTQMDKLVISKLLSIESLGYYTLAISLGTGILVLINPISTAILPRFTALYSAGKDEEASFFFTNINRVVAVIAFSFMLNMSYFSREIIWIWTGDLELAELSDQYVPIIAFSYAMLSLQVIPFNIAIANGYTKLNNLLGIISLIVTIPGYWFAIQYFEAVGAAMVFCFVQTTTTFVYIYFINKKYLKEKSISFLYFKQIFVPLFLCLAIVAGFSLIPKWFGNSRILTFVWLAFSTLCTLGITLLVLIPFKYIREMIKSSKDILTS